MNNEGFFTKLLKGIVSPAARLSLAQQKFSNKLFGGSGQVEDGLAKSILGNQKYQAVQQNPFTEGLLKPLASGASYGVQAAIAPIKGAGLLANASRLGKSGAVAGGLAGLGESAQGQEIQSAGVGAGTGAVLNLLTGGLARKENLKASKVVDKLDDISLKSIFKGTSPEQLKINKLNPSQFQGVAKDVITRAKNISGKSTIDATDLYNIKNDIVNDAASEISKYSDKIVPDFKAKLGKAFSKEFEKNITTYDRLLKDDTFREAIDGFKSMGAKSTVADARALWQKLLEARGGFEQSVRSAGKGTNETRLLEKLATIARDSIKTASPEVSQAMKKFSTVNELLDVFTKNYSKTQTAGSVLNKGILDEALQDVVNIPSVKAKGAQSIANLLRGRGEGEAQRSLLNRVAPSIGGGMVGGMGDGQTQGDMTQEGLMGGQAAEQTPYQLSLLSQQDDLYSALLQATQLLPNGSINQQYELAQGILDQNGTKEDLRNLPSTAVKDFADVNEAIQLLEPLDATLSEGGNAFGPIIGQIRAKIPWDREGQKAQSTIRLVKQIIGKGLEGGVLRKEDEYKYEEILPKLGDTPETVQDKIDLLKQTLVNKGQSLSDTYGSAGYATPF